MSPPPRRGSGKGRGRGGRGSDRNGSDKKRERGSSSSSSSKRGGGRGGGASAAASPPSTAASARPTRAVTTVLKKLVVRNIPPTASEQEARELLQAHGVGDEFAWRFVPGRKRSNNRAPTPARLYLDMKKEPERARRLIASLNGLLFYADAKDSADAQPLDVEFAPFQKIPREKQRKDAKAGTIDRDPEYVAFLEELAKPKDKLPSAEAVVDMAEGETVEKPVAALVKYLNERKVHSRDKGKGKSGGKSLDKNGRRQKGKKEGSKQKSTKDKSKSSKDRQKKSNGDAATAQDLKIRKQRGRASSKKESSKTEATQPGMLRIMAPKSVAAASDSTPAKANGTAPSADTPSERGSEKRGKKNGGRGRNNPKKGKDGGDGGDGEGTSKADSKTHPRRKGGNGGKKEPNNKVERKKKVFAPKDANAQGTPAKS
ncbi:regulator of nonsense transcription [Phytophthora pseudosyringae]|uniref:Regulator of nonsense transcription n=1 Tax=Phytophthora pseudosyringae TaxID=221518 RepID=A0A8T1VN62_9STRA|nr:regulator of nonsense transcription [Phytophthora pseudosyringae]